MTTNKIESPSVGFVYKNLQMSSFFALFISTFTTLFAIINPLMAMPIYMQLMKDADKATRRRVALKSTLFTFALELFFILFGTFILKFFGVNLVMIRMVGGIVLLRLGFSMFIPSADGMMQRFLEEKRNGEGNIAIIPLSMPLQIGPGVIATVISMTSNLGKTANAFMVLSAVVLAAFATQVVVYYTFVFSNVIFRRLGSNGVDALTRIVGFFVAAMGIGFMFDSINEYLQSIGMVNR